MHLKFVFITITAMSLSLIPLCLQSQENTFTNSLDMKMVRIAPGTFAMGQYAGGQFDERPEHWVHISHSFHMSATEVTNRQYEQFDPAHRDFRGKYGSSKKDDEAVIFVSWNDAAAFCEWLSEKEGKSYRLPTEAEWEYACRAGTESDYSTGYSLPETYHKSQRETWEFDPVSLEVGQTPANPFGLYDMHGNVEEWCLDWYGPYTEESRIDPVGYAEGDFRVTRGGSYGTETDFLRSANRSGALPAERHPLIGFRVVLADEPQGKPLNNDDQPLWAQDVVQEQYDWEAHSATNKPFFREPMAFVKLPGRANGPLYDEHNHCPALAVCPNGDLLAIWYTTKKESGRELAIAASRLRRGAEEWDEADLFWNAPDRNDHASDLLWDGKQTLYHFNGMSSDATWGKMILIMRTSTDNGVTWSDARIIHNEYGLCNMPVAGAFVLDNGQILLPVDAVTPGKGGSVTHLINPDGSGTFRHTSEGTKPQFIDGGSGDRIAGIHAGVIQREDKTLLAFGRNDDINGKMPQSISYDLGATWEYAPTEFPGIRSGQRLVLLRLKEGPILFISFTGEEPYEALAYADKDGEKVYRYGMYAALSYDDGKTWPVKKLISDFGPGKQLNGGAWTGQFTMDLNAAEPKGYLVAKQAPDGTIHLISSALHYQFNLAWLEQKMPVGTVIPKK